MLWVMMVVMVLCSGIGMVLGLVFCVVKWWCVLVIMFLLFRLVRVLIICVCSSVVGMFLLDLVF